MKGILRFLCIGLVLCVGLISCDVYLDVFITGAEGGRVSIVGDMSSRQQEGTSITIEATPDEGYKFIGWYVTGTDKCISKSESFTFVLYDNTYLEARFQKFICISLRATVGGEACFENSELKYLEFEPDEKVKVIATPNDGFGFLGWYNEETETSVSSDRIFSFTANENLGLLAKFAKVVNVSVQASGNGLVSIENYADACVEVFPGETITVVAVPDENCKFKGWYEADGYSLISEDATYTFEVVDNISLIAEFMDPIRVSIEASDNGVVTFANTSDDFMDVFSGETITVVATPNENCAFKGWFNKETEMLVSSEECYTFTVVNHIILVAEFYMLPEIVDLGLSVKWATYNVGATVPEEYGGYYAWGENYEKSYYDYTNYHLCNGNSHSMTRYCMRDSEGSVDGKTILEFDDDVAHGSWGGDWRIPTTAEQRELREKCTWEWRSINGVNGYKVTGPSGNHIFLPANGFKSYDYDFTGDNDCGSYWSSSVCSFYSNHAYSMYLEEGGVSCFREMRSTGLGVRPVCGSSTARSIIIEKSGNGSIELSTGGNIVNGSVFYKGDVVNLKAVAEDGYVFVGWFMVDNPTPISTDVNIEYTINDDLELIAEFKKQALVCISAKGNGEVSFENSSETTVTVSPGSQVTVIADPDEGYELMGWYVDGVSMSGELIYTFTVYEDIELIAEFVQEGLLVDLGLPSGTIWAACNVGANSPEEYGGYYAWGETYEKDIYSWDTYSMHEWYYNRRLMTKYSGSSIVGPAGGIPGDDKYILESCDDVATQQMGEDWRMPTSNEMDELESKCTWEWSELNGVKGYEVRGPNGKTIFLPAAGNRADGLVNEVGVQCYYWTSNVNGMSVYQAYYNNGRDSRYIGMSVRAVKQ